MSKSRQEFQTASHIQSQEQRELMHTFSLACAQLVIPHSQSRAEMMHTFRLTHLHTLSSISPLLHGIETPASGWCLCHLTQFKTVSHRHVHRLTPWTQSLTETLFPNDPKLYQVNKANHHSRLYQVVPHSNKKEILIHFILIPQFIIWNYFEYC